MKAIRKLCLRGNAYYLCIPKAMAAALGWSPEESLTVEVIGRSAVRVRPVDTSDLTSAQLGPQNVGIPHAVTK